MDWEDLRSYAASLEMNSAKPKKNVTRYSLHPSLQRCPGGQKVRMLLKHVKLVLRGLGKIGA